MNNSSITLKFGGTSLADAGQVRKAASVIRADPRRKYVVVSAPGKRHDGDQKITDLLYLWHHTASEGVDAHTVFAVIRRRYEEMGWSLGVREVTDWLDEIYAEVARGASRDWVASRGEYLNARLIAQFLDARFIDAASFIRF